MATRSLNSRYQELRAERRKGQPVKIDIPEPTPQWVILHDQCHQALQTSKEQLLVLQTLQQENSRVEFVSEKKKSIQVRLCVIEKNIQDIFQTVQNNIHQIALVDNDGTLSNEEKTVRTNIIKTLAQQLAHQAKLFKDLQFQHQRQLQSNQPEEEKKENDTPIELSAEQTQQVEALEEDAIQREQEIIRLASSIQQLSKLFKELNDIIVEQGTVLDRIDYNVEQASLKVNKGKKELEKAEETSRKGLGVNKCICILFFIFLILLIVLIWKESS